jgi:hypothetical protein
MAMTTRFLLTESLCALVLRNGYPPFLVFHLT